MDEPPEVDYVADLLSMLAAAGGKGLAKSKLLPAKPKQTRAARESALERLLGEGKVINTSKTKSPKYIAAQFYEPPIDGHTLAHDHLEKLATSGVATVFTLADFKAALKDFRGEKARKAAAKMLPDAITTLLQSGQLLTVKFAKPPKKPKAHYLHAASLPAPSAPVSMHASVHSGDAESLGAQIRAAWRALKEEQGFSDIAISDLQTRSEVALPILHEWLREASRAGRAHPTMGDWSKAPQAERDAALYLGSQPLLRVKLV